MNHTSEISPWGFLALVSYIPDPLRSILHGLRQTLPGEDSPQPHITILPPRPLKVPVEVASKQAQKILRRFKAFEVELSHARFFPETNFVYLEIAEGDSLLRDLHDALNIGPLQSTEEFEFRPHLTLGRAVPVSDLAAVEKQVDDAWRSAPCYRRFALDEVVLLWLSSDSSNGEWRRVWSYSLSGRKAAAAQSAAAGITSQTL